MLRLRPEQVAAFASQAREAFIDSATERIAAQYFGATRTADSLDNEIDKRPLFNALALALGMAR